MSELNKADCEHAWCTEDVQKWVNSIVKVPTKEKLHLLVEASVMAERERIIQSVIDTDWRCGHPDCDADKTEVCYPRQYLFALIKGENSE